MVLSPSDIQDKEFSTKMRGYNIDEVNDFLEQIIKDYQITLAENKELTEQLASSNEKLKYFTDLKDSLNQSIIVAQEAADKVKNNSQREADIINQEAQNQASDIVNEAKQKGQQVVQDALSQAKRLAVETDDLRKGTRVFRQRLQVMLESQLEVVKNSDWDQLLQDESNAYEDLALAISETDLDTDAQDSVDSDVQTPEEASVEETDQEVSSNDDQGVETVVTFPNDENDEDSND